MKNDEDKGCSIALVNRGDFIGKIKETGLLYVLFQKEEKLQLDIPSNIREILDEYRDVMLNELPDGLPPIRDIKLLVLCALMLDLCCSEQKTYTTKIGYDFIESKH